MKNKLTSAADKKLRLLLNDLVQDIDTEAKIDAKVANAIVDVHLFKIRKHMADEIAIAKLGGYRRGMEDEIECIETSGDHHGEAVKKIRLKVLEEVFSVLPSKNDPMSRKEMLECIQKAISKLKEKYE